ncbi:hypothetical protein [Yoonia litorea]|uniref:Uncharacterized protein n=1 Tax=Yoonia litorea TaxID=1123755 RepID=A0A1I6L5V6_9RHOB|nr:hypothetical protein [Yoonia litorea]SFR98873.1 hypothetical protein SAMN05444714_0224 [Yoonia litorea]
MQRALTQAEYDQIFRARIIGWGLRWTVGFGVVLVLTALVDGIGWLWPATIVLAGISFVVTLMQANRLKIHVYEGGEEIEK